MTTLQHLKAASSRYDVAALLNFKPSALTYVLFKLTDKQKYTEFDIKKKSGGVRQITAPTGQLKTLQRNLSRLLYECRAEIEAARGLKPISHGFRRGHSIITNAKPHKNRRYVLNLDLENFFPTLNFGRVRGYFLKNNDFELHETVATTIAQIACFKNTLPQGSPCSPIISDLIAHLLDVRLVQLCKAHKCTYTRYADDLTISTNQKAFPEALAFRADTPGSEWIVGDQLKQVIINASFSINATKTRMQCAPSRQMVTGLTVNDKVNIQSDYYRRARSMCSAFFSTGKYHSGDPSSVTTSIAKIEGILNHVHHVKDLSDQRSSNEKRDDQIAARALYSKLLFFRNFVLLDHPLVMCEGATDSIYLRQAIRFLPAFQPKLAEKSQKSIKLKVRFFKYSALTDNVMRLGGGTGGVRNFISHYAELMAKYKFAPLLHPVIVLIDNDDGAKEIFSLVNKKFNAGAGLLSTAQFYHLCNNLYLIKTPEGNGKSCIEDCFDSAVTMTKLGNKIFNPSNKINAATEYGKNHFAEYVVIPKAAKIDFSKFSTVLDRIVAVIDHYKPP